MKNIAFVTYNTLDGINSGWHHAGERSALVLQNTAGRGKLSDGNRTMTADEVRQEISSQWATLENSLADLDHVVVYVGTNGSERAIALAAKVSAEKVTFVGCDCGILQKEMMVQAAGLGSCRRMMCECGGHKTMSRLIRSHLEGEFEA